MAESNRLADFFTPPTTFVLDRQTPAIRLGNAMFTCLSGYQLTGDTTNVVLTNGSLWTSNFMCHENLIRLAFKFQARLTPNNEYFSGACTLLQVGLLSATLMAGEGTYLYVTLGQQTLCAAQLTPTTPFRLRLEISKKTRQAPRGLDDHTLVMALDDVVICRSTSTAIADIVNVPVLVANTNASANFEWQSTDMLLQHENFE
jgi:hypothetical protein